MRRLREVIAVVNDDAIKKEMIKLTREVVIAANLMMAVQEMTKSGTGTLLLDTLLEELEKLRPEEEGTEGNPSVSPDGEPAPGGELAEGQERLAWAITQGSLSTERGIKKAMLSQPMAGKSDEEIAAAREKAVTALEAKGYTVINTLFTDEWYSKEAMESRGVVQIPLCFLAKSLENMSLCHTVYFCKGWENARGCRIEHAAAEAYGLEIIYEEGAADEE